MIVYSPYNGDVHSPGKRPLLGSDDTLVAAAVVAMHILSCTAAWCGLGKYYGGHKY